MNEIYGMVHTYALIYSMFLLCVLGTRDENNGFQIGWLDLLAHRLKSLSITS
jgi:hypothetical protein